MIVTNIVDIRAVLINIAAEVSFTDFDTYVQSAELWIKKDVLGNELYTKIESGTITDTTLSRIVKNVIVLKAYDLGIPFMDLVHTQNGFGVVNEKFRAPASKHRVDRLIQQNKFRCDQETEWLIDYLEDTASLHEDWKSSPAFSILSNCFIRTAREFKRIVDFKGNRNEFLFIQPVLFSVTITFLQPTISKSLISELLISQNSNTLTVFENRILPGIKSALANYAMNNEFLARQLLNDVVNIIEDDIEHYPIYAQSPEKATKDDPGFVNELSNSIFVSNGGL